MASHRASTGRPSHFRSLIAALTAVALTACGSDAPESPSGTQATSEGTTASAGTPAVEPTAPARAYVEAVNSGDLEAVVAAFAPDGQVTDVTRPIRGREAIRTWARNEVIGGHLEVLSVTPVPEGQNLLVHWAPRGSAGWRANYRFTMTTTAITLADLQYA